MKNVLVGQPRRQHPYARSPITEELRLRFPATVELAIAAMFFAILIGVPLGFIAAKRYQGVLDNTSLILSLIGISFPVFFLALLLKYVFAIKLGLLTDHRAPGHHAVSRASDQLLRSGFDHCRGPGGVVGHA